MSRTITQFGISWGTEAGGFSIWATHLELPEEVLGEVGCGGDDGHCSVELLEPVPAGLGPVLAKILLGQVELGAEIAPLHRSCVVQRHRAHTGQNNVLGCVFRWRQSGMWVRRGICQIVDPPVSTPRPLAPLISTAELAMRFMASRP